MNETKKTWIVRIVAGGLIGMAVLVVIGYIVGSINLWGESSFRGFHFVDGTMEHLLGSEALAVVVQFTLFFVFGALVGIATIPFAEGGRELLVRSVLHFLAMETVCCVGVLLNFAGTESPLPWMAALALLYALVWLGRLAAWWSELDAIREKLGLAPVPSPLRWRETTPSLGFALLLCLVVPLALHFFDAVDVPLLTAMLWPWLLVPVGGFMGGLSLGKRHGFCPLYPAVCVLLVLTATLLLHNSSPWLNSGIALTAALAGNLSGAARYRHKQRKGGAAHA